MVNVKHTQKRISNLVEAYKLGFPNEYKQACEGVIMLRQMQKQETGALTGEHSAPGIQRILHEIPEKLYTMLMKELDSEELAYWKSKEGGRWFTKTFKQFALAII